MLKVVTTKKELKDFVYFIKDLYEQDEHYVFPLFKILLKELEKEILVEKNYTALLSYIDHKVVGRVMFTYDESKMKGKRICYFSNFDCINDSSVVKELFEYIEQDMKQNKIDYIEGTYAPYDPDTRRGILVEGFEYDPVLFTSYNYNYYGPLLEKYGFKKAVDTYVLYGGEVSRKSKRALSAIGKYFLRNHDIKIDSLDMKHLDKDLNDVHTIIEKATNDIIYQDAPSFETVETAAREMKPFINPDFIKIAREAETGEPVGFCLVLPDFNVIFKKTKGKLRPLKILFGKKRIKKALGKMQYVVPKYQNTGLIALMFDKIYDEFEKYGITQLEAGTMMEDNLKSFGTFYKFGGKIIKTLRLYGKDIG